MKVLPLILLQVALVAGGLFLYDQLRGSPAASTSPTTVDLASESGLGLPETAGPSAPPLRGGGDVVALTARMALLEAKITAIQNLFNDVVARLDAESAGGDGSSGGGLLNGQDLEAVKQGSFNEPTMAVLRTYLDEVKRREVAEARQNLFRQDLARAEVDLPAERLQEVVEELVKYQDESLELIRGFEHLGLAGAQEERKPAFEQLRARFRDRMTNMVGAEQAEKIFNAKLVQTAGFFRAYDDPVKKKKDG